MRLVNYHRLKSFVFWPALLLLAVMAGRASGADLVSQVLTDIQILYVFDEPESIDWPTLYYLNDESGCRIDLITIRPGGGFHHVTKEVPDRGIYLNQYFLIPGDNGSVNDSLVDSVLALQFAVRRPDVVIFGSAEFSGYLSALYDRIVNLPTGPNSMFSVRKVYRRLADNQQAGAGSSSVTINRRELIERYRERMQLEVPKLYSWARIDQQDDVRLIRYELARSTVATGQSDPDFLSGFDKLRLVPLFESVLDDGAVKQSFINRARNFISFVGLSQRAVGARRAENVIAGYRELLTLADQVGSEQRLASLDGFNDYLLRLVSRAQRAVLKEIGLDWQGQIILRDSPHGPRLKFRASLSVNGPKPIELSYVLFQPYWDTTDMILDSTSRKISPHQSFVREYFIDVDRDYLEAQMPESLMFSAEIVYAHISLTVSSSVPIWETPDITIAFEPDFFFVKPSARVEVDRVVSAMNWKAIISKPLYSSGVVNLSLETPRGVFAGAYRQTWQLEKGRATETVRIPFSVSNLFELGIHKQTITLSMDNHEVVSDTGIIRIASCNVADTIAVGLLPDTSGLLEDILRMAGVTYRPLTDRALQTGDLDAYSVIVVGSGALRDYPSFRNIKGRIEEYLRYGGSLVVFGQPGDWPEGTLPVSFVPTIESIRTADILNRISQARVMTDPYAVSESGLLSWFSQRRQTTAAVISPAEKVLVTPTGATVLSVSRLGEGQVIFCGLPLVEMISRLNIEAIHLFANLLNY